MKIFLTDNSGKPLAQIDNVEHYGERGLLRCMDGTVALSGELKRDLAAALYHCGGSERIIVPGVDALRNVKPS